MIKKETAITKKTILFHNDAVAVSVVVSNAAFVTENGKKIVKAGTPLYGDLTARTTAFVKATTTPAVTGNLVVPSGGGTVVLPAPATSNVVGILQHDVDVTNGNGNGSLIIKGELDLNKIDTTTAALITADVKTALAGRILFLK